MKILTPFFMTDHNNLDSKHVSGGIERFIQLVYQTFSDEIIPFYYTDNDRKQRQVTPKLIDAIAKHNPDLLFINFDSPTLLANIWDHYNVPMLWLYHNAAGGIGKLGHVRMMKTFVEEKGGTLAMVSPWQFNTMDLLSKRINGGPLEMNGGFINPAFVSGNETVFRDIEHDVVTISRMDRTKEPYLAHKYAKECDLSSLLITTTTNLVKTKDIDYYEKNKILYSDKQATIENIPYTDVMKNLSKCGLYFSTCPSETWGITALEAFSHGLPVIMSTKSNMGHASEYIAADPSHYRILSSKSKLDDFKEASNVLLKYGYDQRSEISELTKEKHSKEKWKTALSDLFLQTIERKKKERKTSVLNF